MTAGVKPAEAQRISVRDANQGFSKLIARVEKGERFIVTKNNREVARIEPAALECADAKQREAARQRLKRLMSEKRVSMDGWTYKGRRGDLHERDV
jgi:prevent-host-death family protein